MRPHRAPAAPVAALTAAICMLILLVSLPAATAQGQSWTWGTLGGDMTGTLATGVAAWHAATDASGNVIVSDANMHCIHKMDASGAWSVIGGTCGTFGSLDGSIAASLFNTPRHPAVSANGAIIYVPRTGDPSIRVYNGSWFTEAIPYYATVNPATPHALALDSAGKL